ncbi:MAG: hypothetical protein Q9169_008729 [Polycauliona sp. 2 TL-2023]
MFHTGGPRDLPGLWEDPQTLELPPLEHGPVLLVERCLRIQFSSLKHLHEAVLAEFDPPLPPFSVARVRKSIAYFLSDIKTTMHHWLAVWRCRGLYKRLVQEHGPDVPKLDFAESRGEMDIPGFVSPITTNFM